MNQSEDRYRMTAVICGINGLRACAHSLACSRACSTSLKIKGRENGDQRLVSIWKLATKVSEGRMEVEYVEEQCNDDGPHEPKRKGRETGGERKR